MSTNRRDVIDGAKHELLMVEASALNMLNTIDELLDQVLDLEDQLASFEQKNIELESFNEELQADYDGLLEEFNKYV